MTKTRVDIAREAYQKKDLETARKAHTSEAIAASLTHPELHKKDFDLADIILGGQDGLVNVLGVILGVAAASGDMRIVIVGGLAATFAESISMAAVAYTSTLSEADHYSSELAREKWEMEHLPKQEEEEIRQLYLQRGFKGKLLEDTVKTIVADKKVWLEVMMGEELKLNPVNSKTALRSSFVVGISAITGSFIPLLPFFFLDLKTSIFVSIIVAAITLFIVGAYKAKITVGVPTKSGLEMAIIGTASALVGYLIGSLFKVPTL